MKKRRILIVAHEEPVSRLIAKMLESEDCEVMFASSADNALAMMSVDPIDAFLLDIDTPGIDGITLCRTIRSRKDFDAAPVLFVTSTGTNALEAFAAGCDDLINKPIDPLVLRARLNGYLQRAENARMLSSTRSMLDHYVSRRTREVAELAAKTGTLPPPEKREVVILFTDVRGFTALSEELEPVELFSLISAHLATQVHLVYEFGGYVDKFGGDGLMAVFDGPAMVKQSCLCALQIMESAHQATSGDVRMQQLGIGIHMGSVVIGNIGSPEHFDYSAIGSAVNLAARLCGHAQPMTVVVSRRIRDAAAADPVLHDLHFLVQRQVPIRGFKEPVTVYTLARS